MGKTLCLIYMQNMSCMNTHILYVLKYMLEHYTSFFFYNTIIALWYHFLPLYQAYTFLLMQYFHLHYIISNKSTDIFNRIYGHCLIYFVFSLIYMAKNILEQKKKKKKRKIRFITSFSLALDWSDAYQRGVVFKLESFCALWLVKIVAFFDVSCTPLAAGERHLRAGLWLDQS